MRQVVVVLTVTCVLITAVCIFGESEPEYEDYHAVSKKSVGASVEEYFDNGCYIDDIILEPHEHSPDGFYIIESPDMLDSVFNSISYGGGDIPRLETLFPEGGKLLILDTYIIFAEEILEYQISADQDTIIIDITVRKWLDGPYNPCIWNVVVPVGFVCSGEAIGGSGH